MVEIKIEHSHSHSLPNNKWEAKISAKLHKALANQIWAFYKDFFNLHKWCPSLSGCTGVAGVNGEPGCVRYCTRSAPLGSDAGDAVPGGGWAKERLVEADDEERFLRYEIVENNIGFESYVSTVKILPAGDGCVVEWWFSVDPVGGWVLDDLVSQAYVPCLRAIAQKMEDAAICDRSDAQN